MGPAPDPIAVLIADAKRAVAGHAVEVARERYAEAAKAARAAADSIRLAYVLRHLSELQRSAAPDDALANAREALALYAAMPEATLLDRANATRVVALAHARLSENQDAVRAWRAAQSLYTAAQVEAGVAECADNLRALSVDQG